MDSSLKSGYFYRLYWKQINGSGEDEAYEDDGDEKREKPKEDMADWSFGSGNPVWSVMHEA